MVADEELAGHASGRRRRWSAFVHQEPSDEELAALRRGVEAGRPFGSPDWVEELGRDLGLDLGIRPRGRPRKSPPGAPVASKTTDAGQGP